MEAQQSETALPLRSHTILGVCEAIGEDFGFNPLFLRAPLAASVILDPKIAVGSYLALGLIVLLSRLLFPKAKVQTVVVADDAEVQKAPAVANEQREFAKAA
jgi:phage shock protein C